MTTRAPRPQNSKSTCALFSGTSSSEASSLDSDMSSSESDSPATRHTSPALSQTSFQWGANSHSCLTPERALSRRRASQLCVGATSAQGNTEPPGRRGVYSRKHHVPKIRRCVRCNTAAHPVARPAWARLGASPTCLRQAHCRATATLRTKLLVSLRPIGFRTLHHIVAAHHARRPPLVGRHRLVTFCAPAAELQDCYRGCTLAYYDSCLVHRWCARQH